MATIPNQSEQKPKLSRKKKAAVLLLIVSVLASIIGGTLAWTDNDQHKTDELSNETSEAKYDVTLIETFAELENWTTSDGQVQKEISVKNTGDSADGYEAVYVRIQLREYMDLMSMVTEQTEERYMVGTDGEFIVFDTEAEALSKYPENTVKELTNAVSGITGWYVQTKAGDDNGQYGKKIVTKYETEKTYPVGNSDLETARNDAQDKHNAGENAECDYYVHTWDETDLTDVYAQLGADEYISWILGDDVVLYSEWKQDPTYGNFWIIDDTDLTNGWIYWGAALEPGVETSNFMEAIELIAQPDGEFYYAIHTDMEAVSLDKIDDFNDAPEWVQVMKDNTPQLTLDAYSGTVEVGDTLTITATVKPTNATVTYASSDDAIATVDADGIVTGVSEGTATITVTASNGKTATYDVTVNPATTTVTGFTVAASGAATQEATDEGFTLTLPASSSARTITLTGAITGTNLSDPSLTTWTPSGDNSAWGGTEAVDAQTYTVTIPANTGGTMTVTAAAVDDITKTLTVTINVDSITSITMQPNFTIDDDTATSYDLQSTDSEITLGFTATTTGTGTLEAAVWTITQTGSGASVSGDSVTGTATVSNVGTVKIPADYSGTITVTATAAQDSTKTASFITIKVKSLYDIVNETDLYDTFTAGGREWRVLSKNSDLSEVLILSENLLNSPTGWCASAITAPVYYTESNVYSAVTDFYESQMQWAHSYAMKPTMDIYWSSATSITETSSSSGVKAGSSVYEDVAFILSYADVQKSDYGFTSDSARLAYPIGNSVAQRWWTRTPNGTTGSMRTVNGSGATSAMAPPATTVYIRPAVYLNLAS